MNQFYESPEELRKIQKRREIRQRLQTEFNRVYYNPYRFSQHIEILDPSISRHTAMRASIYENWKPSWNSFWKWSLMTYIPIFLLSYRLKSYFTEYDGKCRRGEIPYEKRDFRRF